MIELPLEIWGHVLSFLHKTPPGETDADPLLARWEDHSQPDLARCMRVSPVSASSDALATMATRVRRSLP